MKQFYFSKTFGCLFLAGILFSSPVFAQVCASMLPVSSTNTNADKGVLPDRSLWTEQVQERTLYSSSYKAPGGRVIMRCSKIPINYYDANGQLVPIDPVLKPSDHGWCAPDQTNPVYLNTDGSTALTLSKDMLITFNKNCSVNGSPLSISSVTFVHENECMLQDIVPGVDKQFQFHENAVKYNYIVKQPLSLSSDLVFSEELTFPADCKLVKDDEHGSETKNGWSGDLKLVSASGRTGTRFMAPICYDANKNYTIGEYVMSEENGKHILSIRVAANWLNDPARAYPVTIDPLVVGPTSTWTNGSMPSCIVPSYNADSIQVTIPGQISITGLFVTSSYYADPFTTAVMSQGMMYFSTTCGQTTTFTVPNPTGNTPGTAYLDSFDIHGSVMCCFLSNCNQRTFYLRMHLGRTGPSTGCNTTYIRYDPTSTLWPFSALVVGQTVDSYGLQWAVPSAPICSNQCTITGTVYCRFGVPPYTVSHPWGTTAVIGTVNGCGSGAVLHTFTLTIPNCPNYCDTATSLVIPPPTITDACGNTATGLPSRTVPLKKAPDITATPPLLTVCSGSPFSILLSSCVNTATYTWTGNSITGNSNISDSPVNNSTSANILNYSAWAMANGCSSDTVIVPVTVDPSPIGAIGFSPVPCISNIPVQFSDNSSVFAGTAVSWSWDFGDNSTSILQNPLHNYAAPGVYTVCLVLTTSDGCVDSVCTDITVIAPDVIIPNVVTPNGDGINDLLSFKYLDFFTDNHLQIYNRWGNLLYEKDSYNNDWNASALSNGTYYFVLDVKSLGKTYKGYFEVLN